MIEIHIGDTSINLGCYDIELGRLVIRECKEERTDIADFEPPVLKKEGGNVVLDFARGEFVGLEGRYDWYLYDVEDILRDKGEIYIWN